MPISKSDLDEIFEYHAPEPDQIGKYKEIRAGAKVFAAIVLANTPQSPDQTTAIRKLRECVMTANASVALKGGY